MCLIALVWQAHPAYRLFVVANRDEWHDRPAEPAHWWREDSNIFAGRDTQAGGTWLGVTRSGRFAAITNFRDPSARKSVAPSRGKLVTDFLRAEVSPSRYLDELQAHASDFNDFNLLVSDQKTLLCFSSRSRSVELVKPGIHALSNHSLNVLWPKVSYARAALSTEITNANSPIGADFTEQSAEDSLFTRSLSILSNDHPAPDSQLPNTGVGIERERMLSPALIVGERYGTRCTTVVGIGKTNIRFDEHTRATSGTIVGVKRERFIITQQ
jgi:uncharacterized protein with NRDE domain